jgi:DmsE family decaheme c-type cytochrome
MGLAVDITQGRGGCGRTRYWAVLCLGLLSLGVLTGALSAQTAAPENKFIGSEVCQACHPDVWLGFNRNPHFKSIASGKKAPEETGCEGCHGPGDLHVKGMGDKSKIVRFPELPPNKVLDECLRCHAKDFGKMYIRRSSHSTGEVSCISCHSIHKSPEPQYLLADKERNVCYGCHADIRARFDLPFKHRVNEGAVDCSDCHNPHGAPMATWGSAQLPRMVSHGLGNDVPCVKCHSDKRGPFAFEHPPVRVEGCPSCHDPHGSTNARLLRRPAVFTLCLECHNDVMGFGPRLGGIPEPGRRFHDLTQPQFQNCVTCHSRIHGSNVDPLFRR